MDKVIKEGTLRMLISELTCDVILSCMDHRLMAHKLILSIASPVFRDLLRENPTDSTTVIILPDISGSMMSSILDYIYTGTTVLYSDSVQEFCSVAKYLQISVDAKSIEGVLASLGKVEDIKTVDAECNRKKYKEPILSVNKATHVGHIDYCKIDVKKQDVDYQKEKLEDRTKEQDPLLQTMLSQEPKCLETKPQKRIPDLLPIRCRSFRKNTQRKMCNVVVPSPWCRRDERSFLGDPRVVSLASPEREIHDSYFEDSNNNFQVTQNTEAPKCVSKSLNSVIRNLYLNNKESTNKDIKASSTLNEDYSKTEDLRTPFCESYQENISKRLELQRESTRLSFSLTLTDSEQSNNQNCVKSTNYFPSSSDKSDILSKLRPELKTKRTIISEYISKHPKNNNLPLDFAQNLSLTNISVLNLPQSKPINTYSPTILNIPKISTIVQENSNPETSLEPNLKSSDISNFNDISNDNSNDKYSSNDSSNDEKKEHEVNMKKKSYKCEDCGKTFSQLRNYKYHRSVHEGTKEFSAKCPECGKMFNDRGYLSSHMKIHRDRKEYACPNCPKRFNQRVAYNMHLRIHTGVKPHECPTCGKSFSRKMLLKQHQRVHTGERPYSCPECGKTFADRSNMSLHARLHTGVKPYACALCPKSFTKKHHLKTHMNFHTGLKPYTCEKCGLAFSQSSNMRTHYKKCILKDGFSKSDGKAESSADNNSS